MKVALISLIQDFIFSLSPQSPLSLEVDPKSFIMAPKDGIWLKITRRPYHEPDYITSHL